MRVRHLSLFSKAGSRTPALASLALLFSIGGTSAVETSAVRPGNSRPDFVACADVRSGGVVEVVPERYRKRYSKWKAEYLSTEAGLRQWAAYTGRTDFTLFVVVSKELGHSAEAGRYVWDGRGRLVGATILLGPQIESGYPSTPNYPVMCSLAPSNLPSGARGEILAAAKLAHEFGHVNYTATQDAALYRLQNGLIPEYNRIFKANGFNVEDGRLAELARVMKGTPSEISREREYQAEANVVAYLKERFSRAGMCGAMPQPIREAIDSYSQGSLRLQ